MAVDGAYNAKEWREAQGEDEIAYRMEKITRSTCRAVAEFAFFSVSSVSDTSVCSSLAVCF